MKNKTKIGHIATLLTIILWGTTYISTKVLLVDFQPVEILMYRFVMGLLALTIAYPRRLKGTTKKQEFTFAMAGLSGICLYYLLENIALTYTLASNVGVIVSIAPCFTALFTKLFLKNEEKLHLNFFLGFFVAIIGICCISFNGNSVQINPFGDFLAVLACIVWAIYSILTRKISSYGYHTILTTRRIFFYGICFMIPMMFFFDFRLGIDRLLNPVYAGNLVFLGLGASALCFVTWNFGVKVLGTIKTSVYIYLVPVVTIITSVLILHEKITPIAAVGTVLTLCGMIVSELRLKKKII